MNAVKRHPEQPHDWQWVEHNPEEMLDGYVCSRCDEYTDDYGSNEEFITTYRSACPKYVAQ